MSKSPPMAAFFVRTRCPSPSIPAFCALAARSPCICSRLRVALRFAQQPTGLTLPSGALRVALGLRPKCPQGTRFPSRLPGFGAEPQSLMPQHFPRALRASEGRKKRGFLQIQGFFNGLSPLRGHGILERLWFQRERALFCIHSLPKLNAEFQKYRDVNSQNQQVYDRHKPAEWLCPLAFDDQHGHDDQQQNGHER